MNLSDLEIFKMIISSLTDISFSSTFSSSFLSSCSSLEYSTLLLLDLFFNSKFIICASSCSLCTSSISYIFDFLYTSSSFSAHTWYLPGANNLQYSPSTPFIRNFFFLLLNFYRNQITYLIQYYAQLTHKYFPFD